MAYDAALAERIVRLLKGKRRIAQKQMFGGACFLLKGHMCCGVMRDRLVVRVGPEQYARLLRKRHVRPMDFTGRPLRGFVFVLPKGLQGQTALKVWIDRGLRYAESLPSKRRR